MARLTAALAHKYMTTTSHASAPDLLAALEAAHRSLVTCNSCHGIGTLPTASERAEIESATLLARAAIAKATAST